MIVDVSTQYRNSDKHNTTQYKEENTTPPDLLLTKNWNIENKNVKYLVALEIKSPASSENIYNKDFENYKKHTLDQLKGDLSSKI